MPSDLQVSNLKALDGTAGISIADSTGRVSFTETNPSITLGSNATFPDSIYIAGTGAFMARMTSTTWTNVADGTVLPFDNVSTGDNFDTDSNFNTTTYKYGIPATGVYLFYYGIYTADSDINNSFGFETNNGEINNQSDGGNLFTFGHGADDHTQTATVIMPFTSGQTIWVSTRAYSDYYPGHSYWGGCRLK